MQNFHCRPTDKSYSQRCLYHLSRLIFEFYNFISNNYIEFYKPMFLKSTGNRIMRVL